MDNRETIVQQVQMSLSDLDGDTLKKISNALYITLDKYEVTERCTDLVPADDSPDMLLKKFIATKRLEGKSEKTLVQYNLRISQMFHTLGKKVEDITTYDLRFYLANYQEQRGITNRTLENVRQCIVVFFDWCSDEGFIEKNPAAALRPIKQEQVIRKPFTADEMEKLRRACDSKRDRAIVEFLYSTGCRISEALALDRTDIDFVNKKVIVTGKGSKQRTVYLSDVAVMCLTDYLESRTDGTPYLFASDHSYRTESGGSEPIRLAPSGCQSMLKKLGKRAGVDDVHPHRFRRTLATNMISRGASIQDVATILGHSQVTTTQVYVSISEDQVASTYNRCIA